MNVAVNKINCVTIDCVTIDCVTIVWSLWCHRQSIVTSSAERKPSEWNTETMCEDRLLIVIYWFFLCRVRNRIKYVFSRWNVYVLTLLSLWCLFPSCLCNSGNKYQITLSWAHKQFATLVHTLFYMYLMFGVNSNLFIFYEWASFVEWRNHEWKSSSNRFMRVQTLLYTVIYEVTVFKTHIAQRKLPWCPHYQHGCMQNYKTITEINFLHEIQGNIVSYTWTVILKSLLMTQCHCQVDVLIHIKREREFCTYRLWLCVINVTLTNSVTHETCRAPSQYKDRLPEVWGFPC